MTDALHLAFREVWRNKSRFLLFSLFIALIALLIVFVSALGEGLGSGNRQYFEKLDGELIVFQDIAQLSVPGSRLTPAQVRAIRRVEGVADAGAVAFASAAVIRPNGAYMDLSLIGVEPGHPGDPPVITGQRLYRSQGDDVVIDAMVAEMIEVAVGDTISLRTVQEDEETFYSVQVVGITDERKYSLRASVFVPLETWDRIRSQAVAGGTGIGDLPHNVAVVKLSDSDAVAAMRTRIFENVRGVEVADPQTAWENFPGYTEQQSTLESQRGFALLIGLLVVGGFFQIQTLQKVPQIGMLKAIGTPNRVIAIASVVQIVLVTAVGVVVGAGVSVLTSFILPPTVPLVFDPATVLTAVGTVLAIGPLGGFASVRYALRVEPLTALGLSS